jgi:hypothetical protein
MVVDATQRWFVTLIKTHPALCDKFYETALEKEYTIQISVCSKEYFESLQARFTQVRAICS